MAYKRFTIRLFPSKEQEEMFWKHIHACRFIWNKLIEKNILFMKEEKMIISNKEMSEFITELREDSRYFWLREVSSHTLQIVSRELSDTFYGYLMKRNNMPNFKSKKTSKNIFPVRNDRIYFVDDYLIKIPKCGKVKYRFDYRKEIIDLYHIHIRDPHISFTPNKKWILSFALEYDNRAIYSPKNGPLGIDMGIKEAFVFSYTNFSGEVVTEIIHNINKSKKMQDLDKKIKHHRRSLDRKMRHALKNGISSSPSNRYKKEKEYIRRLLFHRSNVIKSEYEKITAHIVYDIKPSIIWMEDLNIEAMRKNRMLSKQISDVNWGLFKRTLEKKAEVANIPVLYVPFNYPSSQLCSSCGNRQKMPLYKRMYVCPKCGLSLDRDVNASLNLMKYVDFRNESNVFIINQKHI